MFAKSRHTVGADQPEVVVAKGYLGGIPPQPQAIGLKGVVFGKLHIFGIDRTHKYRHFGAIVILHLFGLIIITVHKHLGEIEKRLWRNKMTFCLMYVADNTAICVGHKDNAGVVAVFCLCKEIAQVGDTLVAVAALRHLALLGHNAEIFVDIENHVVGELHHGTADTVMVVRLGHDFVSRHFLVGHGL